MFNVFYSEEDEGYICICSEYEGLSAFGLTRELALEEGKFVYDLFKEFEMEELKGNYLEKKEQDDIDLKETLLYDGETLGEKEEKKKEYQDHKLNE